MALAVAVVPGRGAARAENSADLADVEAVEPLLPPGISDFDLELYGKLAYTWAMEDGTRVVEFQGDFAARMGEHELNSRDAVVWFNPQSWRDRTYLDVEVYLWQGARVRQPGGTIETGPVLLVTLRTFGKLILNADSRAAVDDADSELFQQGLRARQLLEVVPAEAAEASQTPVQVAPTRDRLRMIRPKVRKMVTYSADQTSHLQYGDQSVVVSIGNVFVSQGTPAKSGEYLELRADAAVLFLRADRISGALPGVVGKETGRRGPTTAETPDLEKPLPERPPQEEPTLVDKTQDEREVLREWVSTVYLEGDVVLSRGQRMIRAEKLYYDFENDRALILDVVTRALEPSRRLPIYVRAEQIRQLDTTTYSATNAQITTSEFHTPHVAIGASEVTFKDVTPRNEAGEIIGVQAGTYKAKNTTLRVEGAPLAYWPYSAGTFSQDRQAFKRASFGYASDFGATLETEWYLFNLLGLERPEGFNATLRLDYFSARGPAAGIDMDYQTDNYLGLVRSYYIHDDDEDDLGPTRGGSPDHENRGRFLWRHRQFLPKGWELSLETSYISDDQFLESFERNEFENGKAQETLVYLLKRRDNWQFSALANWRINEFQTETEHLPDLRFSLIGEPLGDYATFYSDQRAGVVRFRHDERRLFNGRNRTDNTGETGSVLRGDTRQEVQFPLPDLGPLKLTPYLMARGTAWDDSPDFEGAGGAQRGMVGYGIHGNIMASRVYDGVESELFDLHRLRHVIKADVTVWGAHTNEPPDHLTPFDAGVEDIDDFGGVALGLRQRLQTKRGGPGRWETVDWITLDLEAGFFHDAQASNDVHDELELAKTDGRFERIRHVAENIRRTNRTHGDFIFARPEDSLSSNFIAANFQYRISDSTVLVYDGVVDVNRGQLGTSGLSIAVEREPRLAYFAGWRFIKDTDNSLLAFGANYRLNEKHTLAIRETYDIQEGRNFSTQVIYIKKWPRWYTALTFDVDRTLDDIGINLSIWPEGAPRFGLGSKRYTGLADSVGLDLR